jgi:hypothetical protein
MERLYDRFVFFVLKKVFYQFFPGVDLISLLIQLGPGEKHFRLDPHEGSGHKYELTGHLDIQVFHLMDIGKEVLRDPGDGYIVDIEFIPFNKEQKQVKGSLE